MDYLQLKDEFPWIFERQEIFVTASGLLGDPKSFSIYKHCQRRSNEKGFIYLLKGENGIYKIGRTKDLKSRIKLIGLVLPFEIELIHAIPTNDTKMAERLFHVLGSRVRIRGEWFSLVDESVDRIRNCGFAGWIDVGQIKTLLCEKGYSVFSVK